MTSATKCCVFSSRFELNDGHSTPNWLQRLLARACEIHPSEARATLASFTLVLMLMGSYYILRPVRDALASNWSDAEVSWLWTLTFFISTIAVSLYGAAISRMSRSCRIIRA